MLLLCTDGASIGRTGKIPKLTRAWLPLHPCCPQMKQTNQNKGTTMAGASSNFNNVSPSKEHPLVHAKEQRTCCSEALQQKLPLNLCQPSLHMAEISWKDVRAIFKARIAQEAFALALLVENSPGQMLLLGENFHCFGCFCSCFWTCQSNDTTDVSQLDGRQ